ncbi:MAG: hypothetical protein HYS17_09580 [Micavibrio aeruginosavorus]|uniref:Uncharacterized protein n=1 Tax=Micavibrio aeruginosavorus TaxID=349221 RepID=A0A7T5UGC7_9BACT|nr:MAG: hypothetical protein HYS17_09580 [Micavibrio aeruginosavorus]
MKLKSGFLAMATVATLWGAAGDPVFADSGHSHSSHAESASAEAAVPADSLTREQALKAINDAILYMEEALGEENRESLFNDGSVMETLHEKTVSMQEALEKLEVDADSLDKGNGVRLKAAIEQLSERANEYHIATHDKDAEKALAEVKKMMGALKLIELSLKVEQ